MLSPIGNYDKWNRFIEEFAGRVAASLFFIVFVKVVSVFFSFQNEIWIAARKIQTIISARLVWKRIKCVLSLIIQTFRSGETEC